MQPSLLHSSPLTPELSKSFQVKPSPRRKLPSLAQRPQRRGQQRGEGMYVLSQEAPGTLSTPRLPHTLVYVSCVTTLPKTKLEK